LAPALVQPAVKWYNNPVAPDGAAGGGSCSAAGLM